MFQLFSVFFFKSKELDLSEYEQPTGSAVDLSRRTFQTSDFLQKFDGQLTPAGLSFFQSDYDSSVKQVFHDVLQMREPRFEYNFLPPYLRPWLQEVPEDDRLVCLTVYRFVGHLCNRLA
jgi:large subunit ribosomal protein L38